MNYHDPHRLGLKRPKPLLLLSFNVQVIQRNTQFQIISIIWRTRIKRLDFNTDIKKNTFMKKYEYNYIGTRTKHNVNISVPDFPGLYLI